MYIFKYMVKPVKLMSSWLSTAFFETESLTKSTACQFSKTSWWVSTSGSSCFFPPPSPFCYKLGFLVLIDTSSFYVGVRDLDSDPNACTPNTWTNDPSFYNPLAFKHSWYTDVSDCSLRWVSTVFQANRDCCQCHQSSCHCPGKTLAWDSSHFSYVIKWS